MIVVTGGSGFIGSRLCAKLSEEGYSVRLVDIAPPQLGVPGEFVRASVQDERRLQQLFGGAQCVVHLAALIDVTSSMADPYSDFQVNAQGTLNVLEAARKCKVEKVVFASSAAVYGDPQEIPIPESHQQSPLSPYGVSKMASEKYVLLYNSLFGMDNVALRPFNVYGRGQNPNSPYSGVVTKFADALLSGKKPVVYGDGGNTRDFVHVSDVADAFFRAVDTRGANGAYNIGSGRETSLLELLQAMAEISGKEADPVFAPARKGDIARSVADISLAKKKLGYRPSVLLSAGLAEMLPGS